ncbi:MAG: cyclic-di-AMP receptor [Anaerolineales bacterium]|nr:cyclic-di-AMP receptor [Anaerolineales bacterium]
MKLILAIIRDRDDANVVQQLVERGYRVTRVASTGGFLRRGNVTLLIGAEAEQVQPALDLIRAACSPPDPGQHRATVFVLNAAHFEQV